MSSQAVPATPSEDLAPLMIRANKLDLLERLADDLAHEIKNPLHSMVINLEVVKRRVANAVPDGSADVLRYIGVLNSELERVNRRIELLLHLARPDRGAGQATLNELIDEVLELLQLEGRRHNVSVIFEPAPEVLRLNVSREPARQVILNLVLDAIDAAGPGGVVTLRTERNSGNAQVLISGAIASPDGARLAVAKILSEALGGHIDHTPFLVFSLPLRDGASEVTVG